MLSTIKWDWFANALASDLAPATSIVFPLKSKILSCAIYNTNSENLSKCFEVMELLDISDNSIAYEVETIV